MEFQSLIEARRSVRGFDSTKKVTKEQIKDIVAAAIEAPSWKNSQTARYYSVLSEEKLAQVRTKCLPEFNAKSSEGAALVVVTFVANRSGYDRTTGEPANECGNGWGFYDAGLQSENLVLKAKEMGLDTLIMGIRDGAKLRELLGVPEEEIVVSVIAVGYGNKVAARPKRKSPEDIIRFF